MPFSPADREVLLAVKGVDATVIRQIESVGIAHLVTLAAQEAGHLSIEIARRNGLCSRCSGVRPDAAVRDAIAAARAALTLR